MRKSPLKRMSKKKMAEIKREQPIRELLKLRANGRCEECGELPDFRGLHPHEELFRSHLGKLTLGNSKLLCGTCHDRKHGIVDK